MRIILHLYADVMMRNHHNLTSLITRWVKKYVVIVIANVNVRVSVD